MGLIYLVRHAESEHNVSKDFSHRDPPLTSLGITQATALRTTFPSVPIETVITSPLTRAIETTIAGFTPVIDKSYIGDEGKHGGARLILDRDLQERSDLPCDTGSDVVLLKDRFPGISFGVLEGDGNWWEKEGEHGASDEVVKGRAERVRKRLSRLAEEFGGNVVVVTHGVFMKFLSEDENIDLPKAGWKAFKAEQQEEGRVRLVAASG
ncbi:hypothetical protein OQA88_11569 [Cercophora sp. LCS_1]